MTSLELYNFLRDAWDRSTPADNAFIRALESTRWDDTFYADGEHYFVKGDAGAFYVARFSVCVKMEPCTMRARSGDTSFTKGALHG